MLRLKKKNGFVLGAGKKISTKILRSYNRYLNKCYNINYD